MRDIVQIDLEIFEKTVAYRGGYQGVFGFKKPFADFCVIQMDDFDKSLVQDIKLKPGQIIARYETDTSKISRSQPLIKIDYVRGLVYFLTDRACEDDIVEFEKRGQKVIYMKLDPKFID